MTKVLVQNDSQNLRLSVQYFYDMTKNVQGLLYGYDTEIVDIGLLDQENQYNIHLYGNIPKETADTARCEGPGC